MNNILLSVWIQVRHHVWRQVQDQVESQISFPWQAEKQVVTLVWKQIDNQVERQIMNTIKNKSDYEYNTL